MIDKKESVPRGPLTRQTASLNLSSESSPKLKLSESSRKTLKRQDATNNLLLTTEYLDILEESTLKKQKSNTSMSSKSSSTKSSHSNELPKTLTTKDYNSLYKFMIDSDKPELVINCSLMEYETCIKEESEVDVLCYLKKLNDELYAKVGGVVCPADTNFTPQTKDQTKAFRLKIKWVMPMGAFQRDDELDPQEIAFWCMCLYFFLDYYLYLLIIDISIRMFTTF